MRTLLCIISISISCFVIFSLTSASPVLNETSYTSETKSNPTSLVESTTNKIEEESEPTGLRNGSKLVITHVIKTLEFEVDVMDDDNSTSVEDSSTPAFVEADISVLNPELLKEVVDHLQSTSEPQTSIDGTKNEATEKV